MIVTFEYDYLKELFEEGKTQGKKNSCSFIKRNLFTSIEAVSGNLVQRAKEIS